MNAFLFAYCCLNFCSLFLFAFWVDGSNHTARSRCTVALFLKSLTVSVFKALSGFVMNHVSWTALELKILAIGGKLEEAKCGPRVRLRPWLGLAERFLFERFNEFVSFSGLISYCVRARFDFASVFRKFEMAIVCWVNPSNPLGLVRR